MNFSIKNAHQSLRSLRLQTGYKNEEPQFRARRGASQRRCLIAVIAKNKKAQREVHPRFVKFSLGPDIYPFGWPETTRWFLNASWRECE